MFWVYIVSWPMFVGLSLPFGAIYHGRDSQVGFGVLDFVAVCGAAGGLVIGYFADNSLGEFMKANENSVRGKTQILYTGLWRYSQHPNYFGETLWWWSVGALGVICGEWWVFATAPLFNSYVMWESIKFIETRMANNPERRDGFREYQRCTSWLVPADLVGWRFTKELDRKFTTPQEVPLSETEPKKNHSWKGARDPTWWILFCLKREN